MSLSELCANVITKKQDNSELLDKNIIEFCTAPWGLGLGCSPDVPNLYPSQRYILKVYYGLPLDTSDERDIIVRDKFNETELFRFNEYEYMQYLYNEGRINRLYENKSYPNMVLVCGRRSGKCVKEGTRIITSKGLVEIQELGDINGPEYQPLKETVIQECGRKASTAFFYNGGEQDTIRIRSRYNYENEGTPIHRVKVLALDGTIQWRCLKDISVGDYLCINRTTDMWACQKVSTKGFRVGLSARKEYVVPDFFDESWALLLGILVGDGTWNEKGGIYVTVGPYPEWLEQVKKIFRDTVGDPKITKDRSNSRVVFHSTAVREYFNRIGYRLGAKSDDKRIPWIIWKSPKSVVASFLRGLFETDGCAEDGGRVVSFSTASKELAQDLQLLLLNFGIICHMRPRLNKKFNKTYYHMCLIGSKSTSIFYKEIGFISERKKQLLQSHIDKGDQGNKSATESIPYQREWCRRLIATVTRSKYNGVSGEPGWRRCLLRDAFGNVHKNCNENLTYPKIRMAITIAKELDADPDIIRHFSEILESNYFFDRVEEISNGRARVYDLNVPDGESFVANGMTNHNTTVTSCIIAYETYKLLNKYCPQEYYGIMPEQNIRITCVSTSKDTASELFNMVTGHVERSEFFRKYRNKPTAQWLYLKTQRDIDKYGNKGRASLSIRVAPCSAKGLRGSNNMIVALDEMAFFFADEKNKDSDSNKDKNDRAIYKAVTPSVAKFKRTDGAPDGKVICISSPGPKSGKFYEEVERSFEEDNDIFMMQAPTWEIDPSIPTQYLKNKYRENPISYKSEFGAQFSDRMFGWIDEPRIVRQNIVSGLKYKERSMQRVPHFMGIDIGLKNDGTAITIGHWVTEFIAGVKMDKIEVDESIVRYAEIEGRDYFVPDEMADWIAGFTDKFYIARGLMDQYYGMTIVPALHKKGLKQFEYRQFNDTLNSAVYQVLLTDFISTALRLPEGELRSFEGEQNNDSELIKEILTLQAEQKSKYMIKVSAPERKGEHDDLSDSFARMVFIAHEYKNKSPSGSIDSVNAAVGLIRAARIIRRSEMMKVSLNRPSSRMMGTWSNKMRMPLTGSRFR